MLENLEDKYADLLINRCLSFKKSNSLFISYFDDNELFVQKLVKKANGIGINDIYLDKNNKDERHLKLLQDSKIIKNDSYFDDSIWDKYAKKNASFLILSTEFPQYFDDIPSENMNIAALKSRTSKPIYKTKQLNNEISWCIAVMPNKIWAKNKFPNLNENDAYNELFKLMCNATMTDKDNPILEWNNFLEKQQKLVNRLNSLEITSMHYTNSFGTDLYLELPKGAIWQCAGYGNDMIVNMPTYEVFTSPNYKKTSGIVYATKPLMYSGALIDNFWLKFEQGKVIDYDAKIGKDILKGIIESDSFSCYLGECALVSVNSPIAKTKFVFGETCLDENASCHLALGDAFPECLKGADKMSIDERRDNGLNHSSNHVDFMIGSSDLNILADTNCGKIMIFKNGDFNL